MKKIFFTLIFTFIGIYSFAQIPYTFKNLDLYAPSGSFGGRYEKTNCYEGYEMYWVSGIGIEGKGFAFKDKINNIEHTYIEYHREDENYRNESGREWIITTIFLEEVDNSNIKGKLTISRSGKLKFSGAVQVSFVTKGFQYIFSNPCSTGYSFN